MYLLHFINFIRSLVNVNARNTCKGYTNDNASTHENIILYVSILWVPKNHGVSGVIHQIMMFNPVYFIAESYRAAILFHQWYFIDHWKLMLYNICIIILFFVIGSILHKRYRDHFADFL